MLLHKARKSLILFCLCVDGALLWRTGYLLYLLYFVESVILFENYLSKSFIIRLGLCIRWLVNEDFRCLRV